MNSNNAIRIMIADDHALFRTGLKFIFTACKKDPFQIVGEAANGKEVLAMLKSVQPDIILMDVEMPEMNGIEATALIKQSYPQVHTIALSYANTPDAVLAMVYAGADGYLLKNTAPEELTHAIKLVHTGRQYFTPATAVHFMRKLREDNGVQDHDRKKTLTKRETEILKLLCDGESSKTIAASLFVSKRTIDSFREKIMRKAGAKNLIQLFRYALRKHLIQE
ncbi:response regulator transcription factor [Flavisolibacter nicotianae]|uniref:response regulator transcription factor n=1 Tax=Flavisolibacter nicotianae TaxID=2364882 RepID=UPI000EB5776E|nr:response regulator transcription factor [Flavisolibacter nicotianae]